MKKISLNREIPDALTVLSKKDREAVGCVGGPRDAERTGYVPHLFPARAADGYNRAAAERERERVALEYSGPSSSKLDDDANACGARERVV